MALHSRIDHPLGDSGSLITASYDYNRNSSHTYNYNGGPKYTNNVIPLGSYQTFGTLLVRGIFNVTPKFNATLSNHVTTYGEHSTQDFDNTWTQTSTSRYDPRLGLTFLATPNISIRASAGSAISYPYLFILDGANSAAPTGYTLPTATTAAFATNSLGNPTIQPETSFGYDLGFDACLPDGQTVIEGDIFRTNRFNQFLQATYGNGTTGPLCPTSGGFAAPAPGGTLCTGTGGATAPYITVPLYTTQYVNLGDARYDGVELSIKSDLALGLGFAANLTLLHAYDYNISPCLYSKVPGCANPLVNLAVVNGVNFIGSPEGGNLAAGTSLGSIQNHAIPYAQGYGELHYRFENNGLFSVNTQYYGNNNSLNVHAFFVTSATARIGLGDHGNTTLQGTVYNVFGSYSNGYATYSQGVTYPLANGQQALSAANTIGPPQFSIVLAHKFGY